MTNTKKTISLSAMMLMALLFLSTTGASALSITSTPTDEVAPGSLFTYNVTFTNEEDWRGNLTVSSTLGTKLVLLDWNLTYLPTSSDVGVYLVNITLHDTIAEVETYSYQNFTLLVRESDDFVASDNDKPVSGSLVLALVIGFGLVIWGMRPGEYHWMMLGGFVWITTSLLVLLDYGLAWMVIGLSIGLTVIIEGASGRIGGE
jgi:hypothetical protein